MSHNTEMSKTQEMAAFKSTQDVEVESLLDRLSKLFDEKSKQRAKKKLKKSGVTLVPTR